MASSRRKTTLSDDLISELPAEIKEIILECMHTRCAARTALLSTHWKDVWLRHGRLVFDSDFFQCFRNWGGDNYTTSVVNLINNILLLRVGPVKKFTLSICLDIKLEQSDLDRWCLFLSRNGVEELNISLFDHEHSYKLPVCIFLCPTIKELKLSGVTFCFPENAHCIFPSLTSLVFENVSFDGGVNGIVSSISKLEELTFRCCKWIWNFKISAPKLRSLSALGFMQAVAESKWFTDHLKAIKTLCLSASLLRTAHLAEAAPTFPMAINLQVIKLYNLNFVSGKHFTFIMQLLQKSPNLCKLEIVGIEMLQRTWCRDKSIASRILEDPDSYVINQNLKMLNMVKIEWFRGFRLEMLLVKALLSKSPELEKVVIKEHANMKAAMAFKLPRELLRFPRASPKAQIVFAERKSNYREL